VYETVIISPYTIEVARNSETIVPETVTEFIDLETELTCTLNEEVAGTTFARPKLYVISNIDGVAFLTTELTYKGLCAIKDCEQTYIRKIVAIK
jgi:hypothetical protein